VGAVVTLEGSFWRGLQHQEPFGDKMSPKHRFWCDLQHDAPSGDIPFDRWLISAAIAYNMPMILSAKDCYAGK
jgi:hypothetical protein